MYVHVVFMCTYIVCDVGSVEEKGFHLCEWSGMCMLFHANGDQRIILA